MASKKRKSYTPAYRPEAARLVIDTGRPIAHVAREIGAVSSCWAAGWRRHGLETTARHRRWTSTSGPSWNGCGPRWPTYGWTGSS